MYMTGHDKPHVLQVGRTRNRHILTTVSKPCALLLKEKNKAKCDLRAREIYIKCWSRIIASSYLVFIEHLEKAHRLLILFLNSF